jgi:hypothetical protein
LTTNSGRGRHASKYIAGYLAVNDGCFESEVWENREEFNFEEEEEG